MKVLNAVRKKKVLSPHILADTFGEKHVKILKALADGIFLTDQNALGCVYKLGEGIYDDPLTVSQLTVKISAYEKLLRQLLPGIPFGASNVVVQVIGSQRAKTKFNYIDPALIADQSAREIAKFLAADERFITSQGVIERNIYIAILVEHKTGIIDGLKETLQFGWTDNEMSFLEKLEERRLTLHDELTRIENEHDLPLKRLNCNEVLQYYNSVLNFGKNAEVTVNDSEFHTFKEQVFNEPMIGADDGCSAAEDPDRNIRAFVFTHLPDGFALGRLKTFLNDLPMSWDFVWTMSDGRTEKTMDMGGRHAWFGMGPAMQDTYKDFTNFLANIGPLKPYGKLSLKLLVYNIDRATERKIKRFAVQYLNVPVRLEDRLGPHAIASALPLNCSSAHNSITGQHRTVRLACALGFLPIYDSAKGTGFRIYRTNRGFEARIDRFEGEGNRIALSLGRSSAGKSVVNGYDILEFKARYPDGFVGIIDQKTSYKRLVQLLGGKMNIFNETYLKENPYSPFAVQGWDEDDIELVMSFLASSIVRLNPHAKWEGSHKEIVLEALKMCINNHIEDMRWAEENPDRRTDIKPHFTWMDILERLEPAADNKRIRDPKWVDELRTWTMPMTKTGQFGFLFSAHEKPRDERAYLFEAYDLAGITDKDLQSMVAELSGLKLVRAIKRLPKNVQKLIIFEELGVYLQGESEAMQDMANRLVRTLVKTIRKYNGLPHGITNEVADFFDKPGGKAFWQQATVRIFLPMSDAMVIALRKQAEELTEADLDIIQSLHIVDGKYTQVYIIKDEGGGRKTKIIMEIPLSPNAGALFMTEGSMQEQYETFLRSGLTVQQTLEKMAEGLARRKA